MTTSFRRRLVLFSAAITVLLALVVWSALTAWRELGTLRQRLTTAEFQSFRIAEELESNVREVHTALLAYAFTSSEADWRHFQQASEKLNDWMDLQRGLLKSAKEKRILDDIDAEYDSYLAVAQTIRGEGEDRSQRAKADGVQQLGAAAERIFALSGILEEAHQGGLDGLLRETQRSLRKLESLFGAGFVLIMTIGAWGARNLFREAIAPLRRQLIEFQEIAERHEKLASLGVLAAGVAHEIRNPLTALKTRAFILRKKLSQDASAQEDAAVIDHEIDRLERIVSDFLLFARPGDPALATIAPLALLSAVRELLAPELAMTGIELSVAPGADIASIRADPHQLKQVLINLIRNAAESIERKGQIKLRARRDRLPVGGRPREVVVIEVKDTGTGIPAEVLERLFDPFFTTKSAGTGLGLSIAMRILERHGGTLQFETAPGRGTTFGIVLPLTASGPPIGTNSEGPRIA